MIHFGLNYFVYGVSSMLFGHQVFQLIFLEDFIHVVTYFNNSGGKFKV